MEHITSSNEETFEIGTQLARTLQGGDIVLMYGELGAGKTTLTKGIASGFGITEDITSPTFTLMNIYSVSGNSAGIKSLVHIDTYRLEDAAELLSIGVEDYLGSPDTVTIIEWPEKIESLVLGKKVKKIFLEHIEEGKRKITID
jgi:tRNA threonylcarbamoyladenosine biosynthesis protein TsaE